ncbi:uncharacterized protein LOC133737321 [Rosa rugosa]|uniref:uncharacterized protein LOC133737321 n=1 Tax=Rosa rugosa TaxID=74645 RepID=UPI002B412E47|nr:uncharacterized protein LOC133737321 [Rosa rugosa]
MDIRQNPAIHVGASARRLTAQDMLLSSFSWLDEFQKARGGVKKPQVLLRPKWKPDEHGALKLNVDAAFLSSTTKGGVGGVLRDASGRFVAAFASPVGHAASPKQCELMAIRAGLDLLVSLQVQQVVVESDSTMAIAEALCSDYTLLANGGLIDDIRCSMQKIPSICLEYQPRSSNMVAHRLAGIGFETGNSCVWLGLALACIRDVLNHDYQYLY